MVTYIVSYLMYRTDNGVVSGPKMSWILSLTVIGQGIFMPLGGFLSRYLGTRITLLLGGWIMRFTKNIIFLQIFVKS